MFEKKFLQKLKSNPIFCFTGDLDWASEYCIKNYLEYFDNKEIIPTIFITHNSQIIKKYLKDKKICVGIHPNFLNKKNQSIEEIISYYLSLVKKSKFSRSHCFYDSSQISLYLKKRGICIDSNICLFLQSKIMPLYHFSGLARLPVFWEDDIHMKKFLEWDFKKFRKDFSTPGLKIINIHPFLFSANISRIKDYQKYKHMTKRFMQKDKNLIKNDLDNLNLFINKMIDFIKINKFQIMNFDEIEKNLIR